MRLLPYGDRAVLVELAGPDEVRALHAAATGLPGVVDLVPAERTLLVVSTPAALPGVRAAVAGLRPAPVPADAGPLVELAVAYDGEDLADVAAATGLAVEEVVARNAAGRYVVAFCGFAPGFAYLSGLDPALHLPRRATPRVRVPAGSVAVAAGWAAVYPRASPGGWHLLGRTSAVLFDVDRSPPALLAPGTRVRFVPA